MPLRTRGPAVLQDSQKESPKLSASSIASLVLPFYATQLQDDILL
jgi:hypothetical protein